jgi:hypothetical protein
MPAFEVVDQVLQGNPSSHEDRCSAQDVRIRVDDVVVSHAAGFLLPLSLGDVRAIATFVSAKLTSTEILWDQVIHGMVLGSGARAERMRAMVESKPRSTDHPKTQRTIGRPRMFQIVRAVADVADVDPDELRTMRGGPLRRLIAWLGWHEGLVTLGSIAASLILRSEGHVSGMIRRCEREFSSDSALLDRLDLATEALRG